MIFERSQVGVAVISRWIFNCYIVENNGRPFVVDPGLPSNGKSAAQYLRHGLNVDPTDVAFVAITHGHTDHIAGVPELINHLGAPFFAPERVSDYLNGTKPQAPGMATVRHIWPVLRDQPFEMSALRDMVWSSRIAGYDSVRKFHYPGEIAGFLRDGDYLPDASEWRVLHSPGHTDDSTCFYNEHSRTMLSGDTILTQRGRAWFNPEYADVDSSLATEKRLRSLRVDHLFPGHGRPIHGEDLLADALSSQDRPNS